LPGYKLEGEFENDYAFGYAVSYHPDKIMNAVYYENRMHGLAKIQFKDKADSIEYWVAESGDLKVKIS
jgi:hypothetical protein